MQAVAQWGWMQLLSLTWSWPMETLPGGCAPAIDVRGRVRTRLDLPFHGRNAERAHRFSPPLPAFRGQLHICADKSFAFTNSHRGRP